jgi:hypothetical protein
MTGETEEAHLRRHSKILALLFFFYGGLHALAFAFFLSIILALASHFGMPDAQIWLLLGIPTPTILCPIVAGYGLLRERSWAKAAVVVASIVALIMAGAISLLASQPQLTMRRLVVIILYSGASIALCLYGIWLVRKKGAV